MIADLYKLTDVCGRCGTGHASTPCRNPCTCRCRKCDALLHHVNAPARAEESQKESQCQRFEEAK